MILGILQWKSTSFEKKLIKKTQKRKKKIFFLKSQRNADGEIMNGLSSEHLT